MPPATPATATPGQLPGGLVTLSQYQQDNDPAAIARAQGQLDTSVLQPYQQALQAGQAAIPTIAATTPGQHVGSNGQVVGNTPGPNSVGQVGGAPYQAGLQTLAPYQTALNNAYTGIQNTATSQGRASAFQAMNPGESMGGANVDAALTGATALPAPSVPSLNPTIAPPVTNPGGIQPGAMPKMPAGGPGTVGSGSPSVPGLGYANPRRNVSPYGT